MKREVNYIKEASFSRLMREMIKEVAVEKEISREEFGSHVAEFEGLRDAILDELAKFREEIENIKEDVKDLKKSLVPEKE